VVLVGDPSISLSLSLAGNMSNSLPVSTEVLYPHMVAWLSKDGGATTTAAEKLAQVGTTDGLAIACPIACLHLADSRVALAVRGGDAEQRQGQERHHHGAESHARRQGQRLHGLVRTAYLIRRSQSLGRCLLTRRREQVVRQDRQLHRADADNAAANDSDGECCLARRRFNDRRLLDRHRSCYHHPFSRRHSSSTNTHERGCSFLVQGRNAVAQGAPVIGGGGGGGAVVRR